MFVTLLLGIILIVLLYWEWIRKLTYWKRKGTPYVSGSFPFGSCRNMSLFNTYDGYTTQELYKNLEPHPYGGIYIWNQPFLLLRDPELIRTILIKEFQHFRDRARLEGLGNSLLCKSLLYANGNLWRAIRVELTPTFTSGRLKNMFSLFETCASKLDEELEKITKKDEAIDIKVIISRFTLGVITSCAFGLDSNSAENDALNKFTENLFMRGVTLELKIKYIVCLIFPYIAKIFSIRFGQKKLEALILNIVTDSMKYREENNVKRNDFLDLLIQLKKKGTLVITKTGNDDMQSSNKTAVLELTDEILAAQSWVFLAAGFETSSSAQVNTLYELALQPHIQDKLRVEIDEVTKKYGGKINYQAFQEMPYMEQVISETLRKYPPGSILTRKCAKPFTLPNQPNVTIEQGIRIIIPVYALHHDPKYFPEPEKYDPDRFSPENKSLITPCSYLPFGEGPKMCIGMRFGMLQTKMGLYTVLRKYKVLPSKETPTALTFGPTALISTAKETIKLLIKPREDLPINY